MRLPALLLLSALVALGHWLLLAPSAATLARLAGPGGLAEPPAQALTRTLQPRQTDSPLPASARASAATPHGAAAVMSVVQITPSQAPELRSKPRSQPRSPLQTKPPQASRPVLQPSVVSAATVPASSPATDDSLGTPSQPRALAEAAGTEASPPESSPQADRDAAPADTGTTTGLTTAAPAAPAPAELLSAWRLPQAVRLNYEILGQSRGLNYRASAVLDWQQDGSRYNARLVASVFFLGNRTLISEGEITADGLAPTRFSDRSRSEQAAHFQADKGKITFSANTPDAPWQRGAQDRLSVILQLAGLLSGQPERFANGTRVPVYTAGARSADTWAFWVEGSEHLKLPAGDMPALKLTRQSRLEHDQRVEVWFAPTLSYWPVRIKLTQRNGDFVDQQLASVTRP